LKATGEFGYNVFNASIGRSDRPPGYYPDKTFCVKRDQFRSHNRWVIRNIAGQRGDAGV
jgi:hypothetical protein